jgi:hypothetical protein
LPQRCHVPRQAVRVAEVVERQSRRLFRRGAAGDQFAPAVVEMLRKLVDDLRLACRGKAQRRQSLAHLFGPVRHLALFISRASR